MEGNDYDGKDNFLISRSVHEVLRHGVSRSV